MIFSYLRRSALSCILLSLLIAFPVSGGERASGAAAPNDALGEVDSKRTAEEQSDLTIGELRKPSGPPAPGSSPETSDRMPPPPPRKRKAKVPPPGPNTHTTPPDARDRRNSPFGGIPESDCGDRFGVDRIEMSPPLDPGETVYILGCGFGLDRGEVRLLGDFPGGHEVLEIVGWRDYRIAARMPRIEGVHDMPSAKLKVYAGNGAVSDWVEVGGFRADRELVTVNPRAATVECSPVTLLRGDISRCDLGRVDWMVGDSIGKKTFWSGSTLAADHRLKGYIFDQCDENPNGHRYSWTVTDTALVNLASGWKITGFRWWKKSVGIAEISAPTGIQSGAQSATVRLVTKLKSDWCEDPYGARMSYRIEIYAEGPKGVPHY